MSGGGGIISREAERSAWVLRAQARNLKKAWRRGRVRSRQVVEQLLQHLSLTSSSRPDPTACCASLVQLHEYNLAADADDDHHIPASTPISAQHDDDDDDDDDHVPSPLAHADCSMQIRPPANHLLSLASCCFNLHYLSYHRLIDDSTDALVQDRPHSQHLSTHICHTAPTSHDSNSSNVLLKVSIVGDSDTGKTSFMAKYVCPDGERIRQFVETVGVATEEKVVHVKSGTHIAFNIWDLGGHWQSGSMLPLVCRDAAAILIMFDLTRRSTLNSVMDWFAQARECNKAAMTVVIGTKYDHFVELPQNLQCAIIQQARVYARAMGAPLFFSSVTHNINVHKVFKVIVAKLFDLPCPIPINLNFGEPLVDY